MTSLTELERAVLRKVLEGDHPVLVQLRLQLDSCRAEKREYSGVGFFTTLVVANDAHRADDENLRFGDVVAEITGIVHGAGFVVYVEHGQLVMLEGYTYDEPWPDSIQEFTLRYAGGDARDWDKLNKVL